MYKRWIDGCMIRNKKPPSMLSEEVAFIELFIELIVDMEDIELWDDIEDIEFWDDMEDIEF